MTWSVPEKFTFNKKARKNCLNVLYLDSVIFNHLN